MSLDEELFEVLACPECKGPLHPTADGDGLTCEACRVLYPVKDDIPILLAEQAIRLMP